MSLDTEQENKMLISPTLDDTVSSTDGVYYIKNIHIVDSTNFTLVGTRQQITLGP